MEAVTGKLSQGVPPGLLETGRELDPADTLSLPSGLPSCVLVISGHHICGRFLWQLEKTNMEQAGPVAEAGGCGGP